MKGNCNQQKRHGRSEIREKDITVAAEEPAGAEPKVELAAAPLQFTADFQWELVLQTEENDENAAFSMQAVSLNEKEAGTVYTESAEMALIFTLPEGTVFPEEEAVYDAEKAAIKMGDAEVLYFNGLPENVKIFFSKADGVYAQLTEENCGEFGLRELPEIEISEDATHSYIAADVPEAEGVTWKFEMDPAAAEEYMFFDVRADNIGDYPALNEDPGKYGWHQQC